MSMPLLALAAAAFGVGTTEFVVMGLLPGVAADLDVSIPAAGMIITAYAAGVVVGAPIMAALTNGMPRKPALLGLMAIFVLGNLFCALAPGYELLIVARVLTAFCHGAFFGIAAVAATDLVPAGRRTQAVALVFAGLTVANVLGVPGGTLVGEALGWRATFAGVAVIGIAAMVAIGLWVPAQLPSRRSDLRTEFRVLGQPQVLLAMSMTVLTSASLFTVFTFIAPLLIERMGFSVAGVSWGLLVFGVGMTAGSFLGGRLADRNPAATIGGFILALIGVLAVLPLAGPEPLSVYALLFVWGLVIFSLAPPLQMRVMQAAHDAPNAASTLNQAAFNLGNAGGAWLGATALAAGLDYGHLPALAMALAAAALSVAMVSHRLEHRSGAAAPVALVRRTDLFADEPTAWSG